MAKSVSRVPSLADNRADRLGTITVPTLPLVRDPMHSLVILWSKGSIGCRFHVVVNTEFFKIKVSKT